MEGMVTTIEPGIYFIEKLLKQAEESVNSKYIDFDKTYQYLSVGGVRIEDDILVTKEGYEQLTKCPRTVEQIEKCMRNEPWE